VTKAIRDRADGTYHIWNRVNWQKWHLEDGRLRAAMLTHLGGCLEEFGVDLLAWALMANHFHFVLRAPAADHYRALTSRRTRCRHRRPWPPRHQKSTVLGQFMHKFDRGVSAVIQTELNLKGRLWEAPYELREILDPEDLVVVIAYVHRNPVKAGIVAAPGEYAWCSASDWSGVRRSPPAALIRASRLPFGLDWEWLRTQVLRWQEDRRLAEVWEEFRKSRLRSDSPSGRACLARLLAEAGVVIELPCGIAAAPKQA